MSEPLRKWSAVRESEYIRVTLGSLTIRDLANATEARALAAELVRAADEGEPVERSCFTCRHNTQVSPGRFDCPASWEGDERVDAYAHASGSFDALDGMPTNRALSCPGHAPKVTT